MRTRLSAGGCLLITAATTVAAAATQTDPSVTGVDVEVSLQKAVEFLWGKQRFDGRWTSRDFEKKYPHGLTALTAYTLRSAGASLTDRRLQRAVMTLLDRSDINTIYARSFILMLWCVVNPDRFRREIKEDVHFLKIQQGPGGGWGYGTASRLGRGRQWKDNSNSQLALLALWTAASVGADVSKSVWKRAEQSWLSSQNPDGGWGYALIGDSLPAPAPPDSNGSMTAAGLASLQLINDRLYLDAAMKFNGRFKAKCGQDVEKTRPIRKAQDRARVWWESNYRVDVVPRLTPSTGGDPGDDSLNCYLHGVNRVGLLAGRKRFAGREWYRDVAQQLVRTQAADGSWGDVQQTCFAVLALIRARLPVLVNKLKYGDGDEWNTDPRDAANLTRWYSRRIEMAVTWQVVGLDSDEDLYDAPVLLITGHEAPNLSEDEQNRLRDYVHSGGTILAVACCSRKEFHEGCRELFSRMFPRLAPGPLPEDHAIWNMHDTIAPGDDCLAFSDGCRASVFLLPAANCCAWQQDLIDTESRRFTLAGNILRYATFGRPLRDRIAITPARSTAKPPRTITVARLKHEGDWWVDPHALRHLSLELAERVGLGIEEMEAVSASDARRAGVDVLYLTGHTLPPTRPGADDGSSSPFSASDLAELESYLSSGGTLFATACCGRDAFDENFREFAVDLFGPGAWRAVPRDDPLLVGSFAPGLGSSLSRPSLRLRRNSRALPYLNRPLLLGIHRDGRWVVVYSPHDVNCGMTRHSCLDCVGYTGRDARAIVGNVLLQVAKRNLEAKSLSR